MSLSASPFGTEVLISNAVFTSTVQCVCIYRTLNVYVFLQCTDN